MRLSEIEQTIKEKIDLICFWGVLEHLTDLLSNLISAGNLLKPQGRIIAEVPNFNSRAMQILGINTPMLNPREHVHFFSEASISKCAEKASLRIVNRYQELPIINLMYPHLQFSEHLIPEIMEHKEAYRGVFDEMLSVQSSKIIKK
jgi:hypothetical protein